MGCVADTAWFLAGGDKKQMALDFVTAFNKDINGPFWGGKNPDFEKHNIRTRLWERYRKYDGLPATGYKAEFLDNVASNHLADQAHHFSAFFYARSITGTTRSIMMGKLLEIGNGFTNQGDINLANMAVWAYEDPDFWRSPSTWINRNLGAK